MYTYVFIKYIHLKCIACMYSLLIEERDQTIILSENNIWESARNFPDDEYRGVPKQYALKGGGCYLIFFCNKQWVKDM